MSSNATTESGIPKEEKEKREKKKNHITRDSRTVNSPRF